MKTTYIGRFPTDFAPTLLLMRAHLKMARETADDVVRARGRVVEEKNEFRHDKTSFLDKSQHGPWRVLWRGGARCEDNYVYGKRHGLYRRWYPNGLLMSVAPIVNNRVHGLARWWYTDGSPDFEILYVRGRKFPSPTVVENGHH